MEEVGADFPEATVRRTVITCFEAPRMQGVSTRPFIEFNGVIEIYENWARKEVTSISIKCRLDRIGHLSRTMIWISSWPQIGKMRPPSRRVQKRNSRIAYNSNVLNKSWKRAVLGGSRSELV